MTARPIGRQSAAAAHGLRVIMGKRHAGRAHLTPWLAFTLVVVVALTGVVLTQTALDRGAFDLGDLDREIAVAQTLNQQLRLEVARLESPGRVGPIADGMGLVYPDDRQTVFVNGVVDQVVEGDQRWSSIAEFATEEVAP